MKKNEYEENWLKNLQASVWHFWSIKRRLLQRSIWINMHPPAPLQNDRSELRFWLWSKRENRILKTSQRSHAVSALFPGLFSDLTHKKDFQKVDKSLANILTELKGVLLTRNIWFLDICLLKLADMSKWFGRLDVLVQNVRQKNTFLKLKTDQGSF